MKYELHCGDCLPFMRGMEDASVDIVTDPPYGIGAIWKGGFGHGWGAASLAAPKRNEWDAQTPDSIYFDEILRIGKTIVIWGGNYFSLPTSRGWLIWVKPERGFSLSEAELAWTNIEMPMRVYECRRSDVGREHPTQKPVTLMKWCLEVSKIPQGATVFDPFMGSGTTGVACMETGRDFIGAEMDAGYFAIAKTRIERAAAQPGLFDA